MTTSDLPTSTDIIAWQHGFSCACVKLPFDANPYPKYDTEWHHWNAGYIKQYAAQTDG